MWDSVQYHVWNYKYQQKGPFLDIFYSNKGSYRINKVVIIKQLTVGFGKSDR
jgi:hypothetical protein